MQVFEQRASDVSNGYKRSQQLQQTADDVSTAMYFSLKQTPQRTIKGDMTSKFMTQLRLPDIDLKKKKIENAEHTENVLTDSVLFQYAYLDKLLKECSDE